MYDDVVLLKLAQADPALRVTGRPIQPRPFAIAARKGDAELIRWVNGWLARMRRMAAMASCGTGTSGRSHRAWSEAE